MKKSKRYIEQKQKIEDRSYSVAESIDLVKDVSSANFDESVEVHLITSADPKNAETITFRPDGLEQLFGRMKEHARMFGR